MGLRQSRNTTTAVPIPPSTVDSESEPPRPSSSSLNPNPPSTILSYFFLPFKPFVTHDHLHPTHLETRLVTRYLLHLGLPAELVPKVLDHAEYWGGCRRQNTQQMSVKSSDDRGKLDANMGPGNLWYQDSQPIGCTKRPRPWNYKADCQTTPTEEANSTPKDETDKVWIRKCVIEILSKDQGWSTNDPSHYGTYEQSYSWFDVALWRREGGVEREVEGSRHAIQNNVHAGQYFKAHRIILSTDHPTIKLAQPGDWIVLWARAKYQGWENHVKEAAVTVYTSPYPPSA
ncbi:uncharacterized protein IL334_001531 [Kwoniella shivajii]|uniref:Uncharacterized protein n=1 Tax=Kwoniella shivajii TaxID=564305 RepID=A0ABZ1CS55_9TREE|nr:hypothetical protein IL334_001531 [Kwoniella shivajii]